MNTEVINFISANQDGVQLSSRSNNDESFRLCRCDCLTEIYEKEGQKGLDREIIKMLYEYAAVQGTHPSIVRYKTAISSKSAKKIHDQFMDLIENKYQQLKDKKYIWRNLTPEAKEYNQYEEKSLNDMYTKIASLCPDINNGKKIGEK